VGGGLGLGWGNHSGKYCVEGGPLKRKNINGLKHNVGGARKSILLLQSFKKALTAEDEKCSASEEDQRKKKTGEGLGGYEIQYLLAEGGGGGGGWGGGWWGGREIPCGKGGCGAAWGGGGGVGPQSY